MFGLKKNAAANCRVGLAFGRDKVAVAVVRRERGTPILERCELLRLPADAGAGAGADLKGGAGLGAGDFAALIRDAGLPRAPVSAVLASGDYQLALVEAPEVPPAELRAAMRWRLKGVIDISVEDAVLDVFDVPPQSRGGQGRMMYAVAAQRAAIDRIAGALAAVPTFDVIDVPELCLRNLAARLPKAAGGVALLHLGETLATMVLVRGATFYFARQMDLQATLRIAAGDDPDARLDAATIVLELQRSLDYYERHFDQAPITRIAVSPSSTRAVMLAQDLAAQTGFEVETLNVPSLLSCECTTEAAAEPACLLALGAALREEHRSL